MAPLETKLYPMAARSTILGTNMYLREKKPGSNPPESSLPQAEPAVPANKGEDAPGGNTTAESAMAELNLLAQLMGEAVESQADKGGAFKLSMFNEQEAVGDLNLTVGSEVESLKMSLKSNKKADNKELGDIMSSFNEANATAPNEEEDDLLALMDGA